MIRSEGQIVALILFVCSNLDSFVQEQVLLDFDLNNLYKQCKENLSKRERRLLQPVDEDEHEKLKSE